MSGKGTTDFIFIIRQVQEKHHAKKKKLYFAFVDLEKAFDRVPREVVRWALGGVDEWWMTDLINNIDKECWKSRSDVRCQLITCSLVDVWLNGELAFLTKD